MHLTGQSRRNRKMETRKLTCEICKNKCHLTAEVAEGEVLDVSGNGCMRGYAYAIQKVEEELENSNPS